MLNGPQQPKKNGTFNTRTRSKTTTAKSYVHTSRFALLKKILPDRRERLAGLGKYCTYTAPIRFFWPRCCVPETPGHTYVRRYRILHRSSVGGRLRHETPEP